MDRNELSDGTVTLSPLVADDAPEWLAGQDDEQVRWFEFPRPAELVDVQRFIADTIDSWNHPNGHWHWGVRRSESTPLLGGVDLRELGDGAFNLSYVVFPQFRRQGIATRASQLALGYARDVLTARKIVIRMLPENQYSTKVALRLGALYVGTEGSDTGSEFHVYELDMRDFNNER